jgi:hypothetical protein
MRKPTIAKVITEEGVGTGWRPELVDHRDYIFADRQKMRRVSSLPPVTRNHIYDGPRRNQNAEGACVGFGWSAVANHITRKDGDRFNTTYSPRFAYNAARKVEHDRDKNDAHLYDWGAYVRDGGLAIRTLGVCPESSWKWKEGQFARPITASREKAAHRFRLSIYRCQSVDEVLNALSQGHVIAAGFMCHTGMWTEKVDRSGVLPMPTSRNQPDGGHCTKWTDYNLDLTFPEWPGFKGGILFENSWSDVWGDKSPWPDLNGKGGYGIMPIEFIRRGWADDAWAAIKEEV